MSLFPQRAVARRSLPSVVMAMLISSAQASESIIEEIRISASRDTRVINLAEEITPSPDLASLLKKAPGANVNRNGPLTGIAQYRGMYGPRIAVKVDGANIAPSGPNWMDAPLSYAATGQMQTLEVYRGIAPVSIAGESIGGAIVVHSPDAGFAEESNRSMSGRVFASTQSINNGNQIGGLFTASNNRHRLQLAGLTETADTARSARTKILPSSYERDRFRLGYGFQSGAHRLELEVSHNDVGASGTPALPMDIDYFEGDLFNFIYRREFSNVSLETRLYGSDLKHGMSNFALREPPASKGMWRRNTASTDNIGFDIKLSGVSSQGNWQLGVDSFEEKHDSNIDNPNNPMFFVKNFNNAQRQVIGLYAERQFSFHENWVVEAGVRSNWVSMSANQVNATPAMMMPPAQQLRDQFNASDRSSKDSSVDAVLKFWFQPAGQTRYFLGVARKSRAPSYQERFLWLPLQATGGLADGLTYTGNLSLKPEHSNEFEAGFDYVSHRLSLAPRIYYREVSNYIQGTPSRVQAAKQMVMMMNMMNGTNNPEPLQFNNVKASFTGFDTDWTYFISPRWSASGVLSLVKARREDIDDNLYRISPASAIFGLDYHAGSWEVRAETAIYADQNRVSATNGESKTDGYMILNGSANWHLSDSLRIIFGVENLLDKHYEDHLAGYNRAVNPELARGDRLPGYGRNFFARADYTW